MSSAPDSPEATPAATCPTLTLDASASRWISLASVQNHIPIIRALTVATLGSGNVESVEVRIRSNPDCILPLTLQLDWLDPAMPRSVYDLRIEPNHTFLAGLTEIFDGHIEIEARRDEQVLATMTMPIRLLPPDQWEGLSDIPEILAAFVQPNHPVVGAILTRAGELLKSQDLGLSGYQRQSRDVVGRQIAAVYSALRERDLAYASPPAGFHSKGQRIRLPDQIQRERLATCLDLTVLFAACLEQIGLHPLIFVSRDHAWLGCWLDESSTCTSPVDEDGQSLRKRLALGELMSLELTLLTHKSALLSDAQRMGTMRLDKDEDFEAALDVQLARRSGIRPIPSRIDGIFKAEEAHRRLTESAAADRLTVLDAIATKQTVPTPANPRLERWKRKLLDLSLRNKLINFRPTAKTLQILGGALPALEDALADHRAFGFEVNPRFDAQKDPSTGQPVPTAMAMERLESHLKAARERRRLTMLEEDADRLYARLTDLFRNARTAEEESGVSPLYLALGILEWRETERSTVTNRAPLLLIPVELDRSSIRAGLGGFKLISRDEDTRINPALMEKLRQEFGIAFDIPDTPPADDSGVDVEYILNLFRQLIVDRRGWEVREEIWLGEFSFKKFLMWRDLEEREEVLKRHALVDQMLERPHTKMAAQGEFPDPRTLDAAHAPAEVYAPLMADSSQLTAIQAASDGKSFVLEGPPGTGKSQTITNLIVQCMAHGKTVLFVSEKKAALEVVRKRLADVNLSAFCLEVHSDKARKTDIIEQLRAPLDYRSAQVQLAWQDTSRSLAATRSRLNEYVDAVHRRYPCGLTLYEATGWLCGHPSARPLKLDWGSPSAWDRPSLSQLRSLIGQMPPLLLQLDNPGAHALHRSTLKEASPVIERCAKEQATAVFESLTRLASAVEALSLRFGIDFSDLSLRELDLLATLLQQLERAAHLPRPAGRALKDHDAVEHLRVLVAALTQRQSTARALAMSYKPSFLACNLDELAMLHGTVAHAWWPKSWLQQRKLRTALHAVAANEDTWTRANAHLTQDLSDARTVNRLDQTIDARSASIRAYLGPQWHGSDTDPGSVSTCIEWLESVKTCLHPLGRLDARRTAALIDGASILLELGYDELTGSGVIAVEFHRFLGSMAELARDRAVLSETLQLQEPGIDPSVRGYVALAVRELVALREALSQDQLRFWAAWQQLRDTAASGGLAVFTRQLSVDLQLLPHLMETFEASVRLWLLEVGLSECSALRQFIGQSHNQVIDEFRKLDSEYLMLAGAAAGEEITERIPIEGIDRRIDKELALLFKEFNKKSRFKPLRQLFAGMPSLMQRLKPCMLMSPLSVAQHIDADFPPFDLVVFDEASQIPVWDAIGAIARANQTIVVGDPKQMPPTAFFSSNDDDDGIAVESTEELESILDETMTTLPIRRLEWHYRSRYESLITFSNHRYYDGKLVTFPSPVATDRAVRLHRVEGIYGRGSSRTNRAEADAVVSFVLAHLRSPESSKTSIGVVTFNAQQQQLINDLLDDARRKDASLEVSFSKQPGTEDVFVKNLENVQGDERDVIVFSTTFGVDEAGKMSLNFGPINGANGPRRLNVAITRSRLGMHVFTSIPPERIDTTRTTSVGVRHLKEFLDYAERGTNALRLSGGAVAEDLESLFEQAVASALRAKGWEVHHQIGCGGYRVDLGVVNPHSPGTYLAGIECDGASYRSGATARDRDRLRQQKLEDLGWNLQRVWSMEWWRRPAREAERLHEVLQHAARGWRSVSADLT